MVRLLAACLTPPRLCLVMELMETSLERMLYGGGPDQPLLPLGTVLDIALDVAQGLSECMKNGGRDMRVSYYGTCMCPSLIPGALRSRCRLPAPDYRAPRPQTRVSQWVGAREVVDSQVHDPV